MGQCNSKTKAIENLEYELNNCIKILNEIETLSNSGQVYDIVLDSEFDGNMGAYTGFNFDSAIVEIHFAIGQENVNAIFAHELKHAYQFEVGEISFGIRDSILEQKCINVFYDITDEYEAYEYGRMFGSEEITKLDINLFDEYKPLSRKAKSWRKEPQFLLNCNSHDILAHFANRYFIAFRINGKTYYYKKDE